MLVYVPADVLQGIAYNCSIVVAKNIILHVNCLYLNTRRKAEAVKGRGPESVRRGPRESKPTPEYDADGDVSLQVLFHP